MLRYGLTAKKKLGQNFLIDAHVCEKILKAADVQEGDVVLEIGPGIGSLTQGILERAGEAGQVVAVELDKQLVGVLGDLFGSRENFSLVQDDILRVDLAAILPPRRDVKVVANLPYYITTPVILSLLESPLSIRSITIMLQKEVAQRMAAKPGTKDYGSLTLAVQYHAKVSVAANVPVNCFLPRPGVDSAVAHLEILNKPPVDVDREIFFRIIHGAFGQRRKTLLNALFAAGFGENKEQLAAAIESCGLSPSVRGEALGMEEFARLAEALGDLHKL
ncbi:MAG: 16S rRNA (adenine(1518)-N(6)/adenine(1519)-N(6))-dimethyltransferase RsmA [Defluviitaleaceae bacterium]|nr:16S rRNA (adenine(1518)-N(6)/adenine(1519)-N(6))-dimethyltransferase RsmA [Defluviitaleaceae bacterium]